MDAPFASHPRDKRRANQMPPFALRDKASVDQAIDEARSYLAKASGKNDLVIEAHIERVRDFVEQNYIALEYGLSLSAIGSRIAVDLLR